MKNCPKCVLSPLALAIALLAILTLLPATAGASEIINPIFSAAGEPDEPTILRLRWSTAVLELPNGETRRLELPENVQVHSAVGDTGGWWLAGRETLENRLGLWVGRLSLGADPAEALSEHSVPDTTDRHLCELVLLTADGELLGAAWFEGPNENSVAVRAARFDEADGWSAPETVAESAEGTQIALAGAAIADGSSAVVWSAFDGTDDEILVSRWEGQSWSAPQRVADDNEVPDIVPAVAWVGSGADRVLTVSWSRYTPDGYTLHTTRWDGEAWRGQGALTAPGTVFPTFDHLQGATLLTYRQALPRSWVVARLDADGRIEKQAVVADPDGLRPVALALDEKAVEVLPATDGAEVQRLTWETNR
ncbi:MAG: hypothetical protein SX243_13175 [Acidobacteriota bacterium]|nr:hypothetical protein [Acidobacteriota bacterium]